MESQFYLTSFGGFKSAWGVLKVSQVDTKKKKNLFFGKIDREKQPEIDTKEIEKYKRIKRGELGGKTERRKERKEAQGKKKSFTN